MRPAIVVLAILSFTTGCASQHQQVSDPLFEAIVESPAFAKDPARLLFDDAHRNFHRSDGRYAPFVTLMRNDGIVVGTNDSRFTREILDGWDILVVVNAEGEPAESPAFDPGEIEEVALWVERGGSLLLVADHSPFGLAAGPLAERFGVTMLDSYLKDSANSDPDLPGPFFLLFTRENGLLGDHPILEGRNAGERIERIVTFGGQAIRAPSSASVLLDLASTAAIVKERGRPDSAVPATGAVHAVALEYGEGRVVVLGEAAALTAQVITGDAAKAVGKTELRIGMSRADLDNRQLALNIVRWLARRL